MSLIEAVTSNTLLASLLNDGFQFGIVALFCFQAIVVWDWAEHFSYAPWWRAAVRSGYILSTIFLMLTCGWITNTTIVWIGFAYLLRCGYMYWRNNNTLIQLQNIFAQPPNYHAPVQIQNNPLRFPNPVPLDTPTISPSHCSSDVCEHFPSPKTSPPQVAEESKDVKPAGVSIFGFFVSWRKIFLVICAVIQFAISFLRMRQELNKKKQFQFKAAPLPPLRHQAPPVPQPRPEYWPVGAEFGNRVPVIPPRACNPQPIPESTKINQMFRCTKNDAPRAQRFEDLLCVGCVQSPCICDHDYVCNQCPPQVKAAPKPNFEHLNKVFLGDVKLDQAKKDDVSEDTVVTKLAEKTGIDRVLIEQLAELGRGNGANISDFPMLTEANPEQMAGLMRYLAGEVSSTSPSPSHSPSPAASRASSRPTSPTKGGIVPTVHISDSEEDMPSLVASEDAFEVMPTLEE